MKEVIFGEDRTKSFIRGHAIVIFGDDGLQKFYHLSKIHDISFDFSSSDTKEVLKQIKEM